MIIGYTHKEDETHEFINLGDTFFSHTHHHAVVRSGRTRRDRGAERPKTTKRDATLQRGAFGESG